MVTRIKWPKERILIRFKKDTVYLVRVTDLSRHILVSNADSHQFLLRIYHQHFNACFDLLLKEK